MLAAMQSLAGIGIRADCEQWNDRSCKWAMPSGRPHEVGVETYPTRRCFRQLPSSRPAPSISRDGITRRRSLISKTINILPPQVAITGHPPLHIHLSLFTPHISHPIVTQHSVYHTNPRKSHATAMLQPARQSSQPQSSTLSHAKVRRESKKESENRTSYLKKKNPRKNAKINPSSCRNEDRPKK